MREETSNLVARKDELIQSFRADLKTKDQAYVEELRSQSSDVQTLLDTMSDQAKAMWTSYKKQLEEIEQTLLEEREDLLTQTREMYDKHTTHRRTTEEDQAFARLKEITDHEDRMAHLRQNDHEEYLAVKAKLENDISVLEQQLEHMRATYQLNSEKLDYNHQVLKKRAEENSITISQQKRKISKMQDLLNVLRSRLEKQEKNYTNENAALTEDYKRISEQFKELQRKFNHFQTLDQEQFHEVWTMNEDTAVSLLSDVLAADECLMSQQLGLKWHAPAEEVMVSAMRKQNSDSSGRGAVEVVAEVWDQPDEVESTVGELPRIVVQRALLLLSDECEYLIDNKLSRLLAPLDDKQRHLMKLDAIFKGIGVESEDHLIELCNDLVMVHDTEDEKGIDSYELVEPNHVVAIVEQFVLSLRQRNGLDTPKESTILKSAPYDLEYWDNLPDVHNEVHLRTWKVLDNALDDYQKVLEDREQALDMTDQLRVQNGELKMLLEQYMAAEVNRELVIPPTMVLT